MKPPKFCDEIENLLIGSAQKLAIGDVIDKLYQIQSNLTLMYDV